MFCLGLALAALALAPPGRPAPLIASVRTIAGAPRLVINGKATPPLVFFFNLQALPAVKRGEQYMRDQIALASAAGIHLYSIPLTWPRRPDGGPDIAWADDQVRSVIRLDPQARIILRLFPGSPWSWHEWAKVPPADQALFADGERAPLSSASPLFREPTDRSMARMIRHYEDSPLADHVLGYHLGGPDSENFAVQYRERGPDISPASQAAFRAWLLRRYGSLAAIARAWARPLGAGDDLVPRPAPGRFPMHSDGWRGPVHAFYDHPAQRDWVDYSLYSSDIVADRIQSWARVIKRETAGRKLSVFFYAYQFELPGSFSGHDALNRVLACRDVDVLVSPYAYADRGAGGTGGFMSPIDSVAGHGKLWLNEDDTRTHSIRREDLPAWWGTQDAFTADSRETVGVLGRNLAAELVHRAGTWWMDLGALNAFGDPAAWCLMSRRAPLFERARGAYRPQCALIVDERSRAFVRDDWDVNCWTLLRMRDEMQRAGVTFGQYTLADFIAGRVPPCRMVVFANVWAPTDAGSAAIRARLDAARCTAVWRYAPGFPLGGANAIHRLTGIAAAERPGRSGSKGVGPLAGIAWGPDYAVSPRIAVNDLAAEPLGVYADGVPSAARKRVGSHVAVLVADLGVSADLLRALAARAGAHVWVADGSVVHADGTTLAVHAAHDGELRIALPAGIRADPLDPGAPAGQGVLTAAVHRGDTLWFALSPASPPRR